MEVSKEAKDLIKKFEGLRLEAYRCSAGVLTIGYGHTSAAGAPEVKQGMKITRAEANRIFETDLQKFATRVDDLIKVPLTDNQFGACVSLAYNIGIGAFGKSSVLRFVNKKQFENAADAFLLWNKAGGRVLPGLVKRRAAEAALFRKDDEPEAIDTIDRIPDKPEGKPMVTSTTNIAAGVTAAAGVSAAAKEIVTNTHSIFSGGNMIMVALALVVVAGAAWIIRERWAKARDWAV